METTGARISKAMLVGRNADGNVWVEVHFKDGRLSLSGVIGPKANGDARGSCGQIVDYVRAYPAADFGIAPGWTAEMLDDLIRVWDGWHLNDMHAGCVHQRAAWDVSEQLEVVSYGLTSEAYRLRNDLLALAGKAAARGEVLETDARGRALLGLTDWYADKPAPPDADSPLSGCYEVKKRENKAAGWVYPKEHARGLLTKACDVCGYKYGSAWLREEVPADVLALVESWPASPGYPWGLRD